MLLPLHDCVTISKASIVGLHRAGSECETVVALRESLAVVLCSSSTTFLFTDVTASDDCACDCGRDEGRD